MLFTIIESPYSGDVDRNLAYLKACIQDCIKHKQSPYASHQMIAASGALDDFNPEERALGIKCGIVIYNRADYIAFYVDLGWSNGMKEAYEVAKEKYPTKIEIRQIGWKAEP